MLSAAAEWALARRPGHETWGGTVLCAWGLPAQVETETWYLPLLSLEWVWAPRLPGEARVCVLAPSAPSSALAAPQVEPTPCCRSYNVGMVVVTVIAVL